MQLTVYDVFQHTKDNVWTQVTRVNNIADATKAANKIERDGKAAKIYKTINFGCIYRTPAKEGAST